MSRILSGGGSSTPTVTTAVSNSSTTPLLGLGVKGAYTNAVYT